MHFHRMMVLGAFAAGLAALPLSTAQAQYYYPPPCSPFPLSWPFCVVGAAVGVAATIVTAPLWLLTGAPPPFYYGYYGPPHYPPPPYPAMGYNPPPYNYGPR
jgi:hypothetical protein